MHASTAPDVFSWTTLGEIAAIDGYNYWQLLTVIHVYSKTVIKPSLAVIDRASVRRRPLRSTDLRGPPPHCAGRATPLSRRLEHNMGRAVPGLQRNPVPSRPPPGRREPNMTVLRSRGIGACDEGHPRLFSAYKSS